MFYQKYGVGFYTDKATLNPTSQISVPSKVGYSFTGYYKNIFGVGTPLIKEDGSIALNNTSYMSDATIYAGYEAMKFTIMFDMQGGTGGTETAIATYDQELPYAEAPIRDGYTFKGYYTGTNGTGEKYYNEYMSPDMDSNPDDTYKLLTNLTLYAFWVDESAPTVTLTADYDTWTNREIVLTVDAFDNGKGLKSVELFQGENRVDYFDNLNGTQRKSFTFNNETEGVVMYKAVATDMNDNQTECFVTVKYDKSAPKGTIVEEIIDGNKFTIVIDSWDTNPDNP